MVSAINSTKPADGTPAVKAELRANLEAARSEINHGGFAVGLSPANYTPQTAKVADHLAAIDSALSGGGGASTFTALSDTPSSYSGHGSKFVKVTSAANGLEFVTSGGATNADAVTYSPNWTGAGSRSVQSRLMDVASVVDFGADPSGSADSLAAIHAARDTGAGVIFFPPGSYTISGPITLDGTAHRQRTLWMPKVQITARSGFPTSGVNSALIKVGSRWTTIRGYAELRGQGLAETAVRMFNGAGEQRDLVLETIQVNGCRYGFYDSGNSMWRCTFTNFRIDVPEIGFLCEGNHNTLFLFQNCYVAAPTLRGWKMRSTGSAVFDSCAVDSMSSSSAYAFEFLSASSGFVINGFDYEANIGGFITQATGNATINVVGGMLNCNGCSSSTPPLFNASQGVINVWGMRLTGSTNFPTLTSGSGAFNFHDCSRNPKGWGPSTASTTKGVFQGAFI